MFKYNEWIEDIVNFIEYEKLKEDGKLIELPFVPQNDMVVYDVIDVVKNGEDTYREVKIKNWAIKYNRNGWYFVINEMIINFDEFNKNIFIDEALAKEKVVSILNERKNTCL